jgi:exosortase A-associated hydrolase 1
MLEKAITFNCNGSELLGIVNAATSSNKTAVLIVVGGPQYRVGRHRQFVQLARALAKAGISSMRFDYRGMGDSEGDKQSFDTICDDLAAASDAMCNELQCEKIVIWGLCDAASAAMIYAHKDKRVSGLILLNPWLRSEQSTGKTMLKHYYLQRLFAKDFWLKLLRGQVNVKGSMTEVAGYAQDSVSKKQDRSQSYQSRMKQGVINFDGEICLILSGADLTAKEFQEQALGADTWSRFKADNVKVHNIVAADHTFSNSEFKSQVEEFSATFVSGLSH